MQVRNSLRKMLHGLVTLAGIVVVLLYGRKAVGDFREKHPMFSDTEHMDENDALAFQGHPPRPNPGQIRANPYN
jgi:hypothetical protein